MPNTRSSISIPEFTFEDGSVIRDVEIVYSSWGSLNAAADNAVLACHALTANTNLEEWWPGMIGPGRALDPDRHFVICPSLIGSPYGGLSPLTINVETGKPFGPDFPRATVRDTVALHRVLLDELGVRQIRFGIGASLGAMQILEWAIVDDRMLAMIPIAAGKAHSAWGIGWSETQRQCIFADPKWNNGYYDPDDPPAQGLANARMIAMLSYRSSPSFSDRFGRRKDRSGGEEFDVQTYLRYQGQKLVDRFDANCYVSLTRQMNSYDVGRDRDGAEEVLADIEIPALVLGVQTDILYPVHEQEELTRLLPNAELQVLDAPQGHDAFLIELDDLSERVTEWLKRKMEEDELPCQAA
jgi:homoserine O-acetyltransferase